MKKTLIFLAGLIGSLPLSAQKDTLSSTKLITPEKEAIYVSSSKKDNAQTIHPVISKIVGEDTNEAYINKKLSEKEQPPVNQGYTFTPEEQHIIDMKKLASEKYLSSQTLSKEQQTMLSKEQQTVLSKEQQTNFQEQ
jgi:hypothetical protein